jgi:hypothetical protein
MTRFLIPAAIVAALAAPMAAMAETGRVPGTAPAGPRLAAPGAGIDGPLAASGLKVFYQRFDKLSLSVDAAGSNDASHVISVNKPSKTAVVLKAYLMAASYFQQPIANGDVRISGSPVTWIDSETNDITGFPGWFNSVLGDVTSVVKPKVDARASAGRVDFTITENATKNSYIDGQVLVVVFKDRALTRRNTVALLFGGQQLAGDRFEITLLNPIDKKDKSAKAEMGLGISYSYQSGGSQQYSIIDVNGRRLSTASGGEDDGGPFNGALVTAGGLGDAKTNPPNAFATPTNPRSDDERYNLLPFITSKTKTIRIDTVNPSNDDNIFFAWFDFSASGEVNKDTDGDGLLDSWERKGYDHDGDGKIDVPIHRRGANYKKKDIFVAYAWMNKSPTEAASHQPSVAVLSAITQAFARAPVSNPDKSKGIAIHWLNKGGVPHDDDLNEVWTEFDAIMNPLVSEAERRIYHRLLNAHGYSGGSSSGLSRGIPASDFIESLGLFPTNPGTFTQRAGTIMHELGHNLGLRHGGVDHENYKPNHLSIMSYLNQLDWLTRNGKPYLDYERFRLADLNEAKLSEAAGLNRIGGDKPISNYGVRWFSAGTLRSKATGANKNVNWNFTGSSTQTNVAVDLNNSGGLSVLRGRYSEWDNIVFDGGDVGAGSPSERATVMTGPEDLVELTYEDWLRMQAR